MKYVALTLLGLAVMASPVKADTCRLTCDGPSGKTTIIDFLKPADIERHGFVKPTNAQSCDHLIRQFAPKRELRNGCNMIKGQTNEQKFE